MIEIKKNNNKETDLPLCKHGVDGKILFECWKRFHSLAALTREIFFQHEKRNSYLQATM